LSACSDGVGVLQRSDETARWELRGRAVQHYGSCQNWLPVCAASGGACMAWRIGALRVITGGGGARVLGRRHVRVGPRIPRSDLHVWAPP
jgi:hypothetical protein